jgi:enediyne biosynthesis protein E4
VRQTGGGSLLMFENRLPKANWLEVSLAGKKSNRLGIGARVTAEFSGQKIVRELYPHNTFRSQAPARVQFGLGKAPKVDRLTIRWPSGLVQELTEVAANRRLRIEEDGDRRAQATP